MMKTVMKSNEERQLFLFRPIIDKIPSILLKVILYTYLINLNGFIFIERRQWGWWMKESKVKLPGRRLKTV